MTLSGIRHTIRWVLHNAAEFDRRHLHGGGAWLFGRRQVRPQRPPRRITSILLIGAWLALLTRTLPLPQVLVMAAILAAGLLSVAAVLAWPVAMGKVKGWRHRADGWDHDTRRPVTVNEHTWAVTGFTRPGPPLRDNDPHD